MQNLLPQYQQTKKRFNKATITMMNGTGKKIPIQTGITAQLRRSIDVERVTTIREVIPVETYHAQEAFDLAATSGEVLTSETTVEFIIRNYPIDY
jgi:hypothetical protein